MKENRVNRGKRKGGIGENGRGRGIRKREWKKERKEMRRDGRRRGRIKRKGKNDDNEREGME